MIVVRKREGLFAVALAFGLIVFGKSIIALIFTQSDLYSHIPVVYLICGYALVTERNRIFSEASYSVSPGVLLVAASAAVFIGGVIKAPVLSQNDFFAVMFLAMAMYVTGIFTFFFGVQTSRKAIFPIFLLLLAIPIPDYLLDHVIVFLQVQSYNAACWVLDTLRMYPIKEGFSIILPDVSVEVAKQCSGIRSSIALLIISVLYGRYFLRTNPGRVLLVILTLFVAPYKNGLRIATLVLLSIYWDKMVLSGPLHSAGGIPFFVIGLVWLSLILFVLARVEKWVLGRFGRGEGEVKEAAQKGVKEIGG